MTDFNFVSADNMQTLEHYGAAMIVGLTTLKTLESFHIQAFTKGLLNDGEMETGKTICWEIQRLINLYKTQIENIVERTGLDEKLVLAHLQSMMPDLPKIKKNEKKSQEQ